MRRSLKCCLKGPLKYREVWSGKSQSGERGGGQYYTDVGENAVRDGAVSREGVRQKVPRGPRGRVKGMGSGSEVPRGMGQISALNPGRSATWQI